MIESIFQSVGDAITQFATVLGNGFTSLMSIFFDADAGYALTPLGQLAMVGFGVSMVFWAYNLVRQFLRIR